jgi:hypothetical protein
MKKTKKTDIRPIYPKEFGKLMAQCMNSFEILTESVKETLKKKTDEEISKDIQEGPRRNSIHRVLAGDFVFSANRIYRIAKQGKEYQLLDMPPKELDDFLTALSPVTGLRNKIEHGMDPKIGRSKLTSILKIFRFFDRQVQFYVDERWLNVDKGEISMGGVALEPLYQAIKKLQARFPWH